MTALLILTDDRIVTLTTWVVCTLGTGLVGAAIYIYNLRVKETKALSDQIGAFTEALNQKFKALNNLAHEFKQTKAEHGKELLNLKEETKITASKLNEVDKKTVEHNVEITNLKLKYQGL